jgi:myosin-7
MKRAVNLNQEIEQQVHVNLHTLQAYAEKYFRSKKTTAWHYEATELKGPLLHRFEGQTELSAKAVGMFRAIMVYAKMSPQERKKIQQSDLDSIFDSAFEKNKVLKEELYCQLIKQLTFCPDMKMETRIWELLWLLTGVLIPGKVLFQHVILFLRSSSNPTALECYSRIQKIQK